MAYRVQDPEVESNIIPGKPPSIQRSQLHEGYKPFRGKYGIGYKPSAGLRGYKRPRKS